MVINGRRMQVFIIQGKSDKQGQADQVLEAFDVLIKVDQSINGIVLSYLVQQFT
jgi:hypothetical protein